MTLLHNQAVPLPGRVILLAVFVIVRSVSVTIWHPMTRAKQNVGGRWAVLIILAALDAGRGSRDPDIILDMDSPASIR